MSQKVEIISGLIALLHARDIGCITTFLQGEDAFLLAIDLNGTMSPSEISVAQGITKGRVTALISSLSEKNLISLSIDSLDRRKFKIEMTDEGKEYLRIKKEKAEVFMDKVLSGIGEERTSQLIKIISDVNSVIKEGL